MARFSRPQTADGHSRASMLELFYDLVFVFAITQVSHFLLAGEDLHNLTWEGVGQAAVILAAVWWSWNYTTWATNELDTSAPAVRGMVVAVMLGSLLMSIAIPYAWGDRALMFAGAYVAIHIGRHLFLTFASGSKGSSERERAAPILVWFCFSGVFWIGGALADAGSTRTLLWLIGLLIDYSAPLFVYRVPGMARLRPEAWDVDSEHFAERFQLFVIIALGESIVITGATTSELNLGVETVAALIVAFLGSAAFWWLYFNRAADRMAAHLANSQKRTELARDIYTYMHVLVIAAIIVAAVGDELLIQNHGEPLPTNELIALVAGPPLYLIFLSLIRFRSIGSISSKRTIAAVLCVAIGFVFSGASALLVASLLVAVLVVLIVAEELSPAIPPLLRDEAPTTGSG